MGDKPQFKSFRDLKKSHGSSAGKEPVPEGEGEKAGWTLEDPERGAVDGEEAAPASETVGGRIHFVLLRGPGEPYLDGKVARADVFATLASLGATAEARAANL